MSVSLRVAVLGLGRMGRPIAHNIAQAGFPLTVYNRTRATAEAFAASTPSRVASTPREAAENADVLITSVADRAALDALYDGDEGILRGLRPDTVAVEMSTVGPEAVAALRGKVASAGASLVDAPVVGNDSAAAARRLVVLAAGDAEPVERARPVFEALGPKVLHVGPSGSGATLKLAINTIVAGLNQCVAEALVLAEKAGVAREVTLDAIMSSTLGSAFLEHRRPGYLQTGSMPVAFRLALARKDLALAIQLAAGLDTPLPQANLNLRVIDEALAAGYADQDISALVTYLAST